MASSTSTTMAGFSARRRCPKASGQKILRLSLRLLVKDSQWYEQHFRGVSKRLTALLRQCNTYEFQRIRRTRIQGDVALIDFLLTTVMQKNFPKLCPASLWALVHCMNKQRFTFGLVVGTDNLRCDPAFTREFENYLRREKGVNPAE